MSNIPILGQVPDAPRIHPQQRLNVAEAIGKTIEQTKALGLQHGRQIIKTPADRTSAEYLLYFDALLDAGCTIVGLCEHALGVIEDVPWLQAHIVFRLPREMAT